MFQPIEVHPLPGFRLRVRYSDGVEGEVDLSHLAGKGVFKLWDEPGAFEQVHIGPGGGIAWSEQVDICPDNVYMQITGKKAEELFPRLAPATADA